MESVRTALPCGDYAVRTGDRLLAAVERKTLGDLIKWLVDGSLAYTPACPVFPPPSRWSRLATHSCWLHRAPSRGWLAELTARLQGCTRKCRSRSADSHKLAEDSYSPFPRSRRSRARSNHRHCGVIVCAVRAGKGNSANPGAMRANPHVLFPCLTRTASNARCSPK